ncbi:MAG: hypothetical protein AB1414_11900 [bacterium]
MFKRMFLIGVMGILISTSSLVFSEEEKRILPGCEVGDAVFARMQFWGIQFPDWIARFGHAGVYYCSSTRKGEEAWNPDKGDLVNSNMEFATIEAVFTITEGARVQICKFSDSFGGRNYEGAYNNGGLKAGDRIDIITRAFNQLKAIGIPPFPETRRWPAIKDPNHKEVKERAFSCDGIVEYCYEVL